jgi:hypothetical protein
MPPLMPQAVDFNLGETNERIRLCGSRARNEADIALQSPSKSSPLIVDRRRCNPPSTHSASHGFLHCRLDKEKGNDTIHFVSSSLP